MEEMEKKIRLQFTPEQYKKLVDGAEANGLSLNDFLLKLICDFPEKEEAEEKIVEILSTTDMNKVFVSNVTK